MGLSRNLVDSNSFNPAVVLPFELRTSDVHMAMQDVYDFFYDVNRFLLEKGLQRLDEMLRPAIMSGVLSDMLTASLARHSRVLRENTVFNGHPDLIGNPRGELGTRTATLHREGIAKLRANWVYRLSP